MKKVSAVIHRTKEWYMDYEIEVPEDATDAEIRRQLREEAERIDPHDPRWQKPQILHTHVSVGEFEVEND